MNAGETIPNRYKLLVLAILVLVWFSNIEYRKLVEPDEGRYAEIPREMVVTGDWITPRLNGIKYFEKPPLQYWVTAGVYTVFGEHHWTARLWPILAGLLTIILIAVTGRALFGAAAGAYAGLVLAGSAGFVAMTHVNILDPGLTLFMTLTLCAFLRAQQRAIPERARLAWMLLAWAAMALAVLSKGLVGLVLPSAVLVIYVLIERDWALLRRLHIAAGVPLFLAIAAPWFVLVQRANPEFFDFFFVHEHFQRFLTTAHGRVKPWWFFLVILSAGILPWIVPMLTALYSAARYRSPEPGVQPMRLLVIWCAFIFLFFSLSHSKLPSYILPVFPALALIVGERMACASPQSWRWQLLPLPVLGLLILMFAPSVAGLAKTETEEVLYRGYVPWVVAAGLAALISGAWAVYQSYCGRKLAAVSVASIGGLLSTQLVMTGHDSLAPIRSGYHIAQSIRPYLQPGIPLYSVAMYDQTLPFYLRNTMILAGYRGELAFGLDQEPQRGLPDLQAFAAAWVKHEDALAVIHPIAYEQFKASGLPMQVVARDAERVVVRKPRVGPILSYSTGGVS